MSWRTEVSRALKQYTPPDTPIDWLKIEKTDARLTDHQKTAIQKAYSTGGFVGRLVVGAGKSLVLLILARLLKDPLLVLPASLKTTMQAEYEKWKDAFSIRLPEMVSYTYISRNEDALTKRKPKTLLFDEGHHLGGESIITRRVIHYLEANPDTQVHIVTGTLGPFERYATAMEMAFGDMAPVPTHTSARTAWGHILSPRQEVNEYDWPKIKPLAPKATTRSEYRRAFYKHLSRHPGVHLMNMGEVGASIRVFWHKSIEIPPEVQEVLNYIEANDSVPDGDVFASPAQRSDAIMQVLAGFHYVWDWGGIPEKTKLRWKHARKDYLTGVNAYIQSRKDRALGPEQVYKMMELPKWLERSRARWMKVKDDCSPVRHQKSLSNYLINWSMSVGKSPLIWYKHQETADALSRRSSSWSPGSHGRCHISMGHLEGKNLQAWSESVVTYLPMANPLEQLIGRTHRRGQEADEVHVHIPAHHGIYLKKRRNIMTDAKAIQEERGIVQKILLADEVWV